MADIKFKKFVKNAWDPSFKPPFKPSDWTPIDGGNTYVIEETPIRIFYEICASSLWSKDNIKSYLISAGYGEDGYTIRRRDWKSIKAIRRNIIMLTVQKDDPGDDSDCLDEKY